MTVHNSICKLPPSVLTLNENNRGLKVSGFSAKLKKLSSCSIKIVQILVNYSHLHLDWFYILRKKRNKWKKQGK